MSLNLCAYQPAVIWSSSLYIAFGVFMLVGLMFSPGNFTDHQSKLEKGWLIVIGQSSSEIGSRSYLPCFFHCYGYFSDR